MARMTQILKVTEILTGALCLALLVSPSRLHADETGINGIGGRVSLFSDSEPLAYSSAAPTYVAPPAPPPIYIDQNSKTYCRPFSQETRIAGHRQETYGTACLQPDGSWRIAQ